MSPEKKPENSDQINPQHNRSKNSIKAFGIIYLILPNATQTRSKPLQQKQKKAEG